MVIGTGIITFRLHDCRSLKGKRKVIKSIISRLRNNFNASVAEIGSNDVHQRAEIGFSLVGNDQAIINSKIDKMVNLAEDLGLADGICARSSLEVSGVNFRLWKQGVIAGIINNTLRVTTHSLREVSRIATSDNRCIRVPAEDVSWQPA